MRDRSYRNTSRRLGAALVLVAAAAFASPHAAGAAPQHVLVCAPGCVQVASVPVDASAYSDGHASAACSASELRSSQATVAASQSSLAACRTSMDAGGYTARTDLLALGIAGHVVNAGSSTAYGCLSQQWLLVDGTGVRLVGASRC